jgi:hypothetical protein
MKYSYESPTLEVMEAIAPALCQSVEQYVVEGDAFDVDSD